MSLIKEREIEKMCVFEYEFYLDFDHTHLYLIDDRVSN